MGTELAADAGVLEAAEGHRGWTRTEAFVLNQSMPTSIPRATGSTRAPVSVQIEPERP